MNPPAFAYITRREREIAKVFRDLRDLIAARLSELCIDGLPRTSKSIQHTRIDDVSELGNRLSALAFQRYEQPLVLVQTESLTVGRSSPGR